MTHPPGPMLTAAVQTAAYHRDPLGVLRRARARHGPVFMLRVADPILFVGEPAAVDTVCTRAVRARALRAGGHPVLPGRR